MAEVGSEQRVALSVSNCAEWLRGEGRRIEEVGEGLVAQPCIPELVRTILPSAVERGGTIVIAVLLAIALERVIGTAAGFGDREGLSTLPDQDRICLPSGEGKLFDAGEVLSVLKFVIKREGEAVLDVVFGNAVLNLADVGRIGVAPTLVSALLGEASDIAQPLAPGVVCVECEALGKAALKGGLQCAVVRYALALDVADPGQIGKLRGKRTCRPSWIGDGLNGAGWLMLLIDSGRCWPMLPT